LRFVAAVHPALHPGRSARVEFEGRPIGWLGELHPRWQQKYELAGAAVVFELDVEPLREVGIPLAAAVARFPAIQRDIAVWVSEQTTVQQIQDAVQALAERDGRLSALRDFRLFDLYRAPSVDSSKVAGVGANVLLNKEKSLAFRIVLQDTEKTLSDAEADAAVDAIAEELSTRLGARLRQ
jgi:phenylalanyl-tRNA synthetase beta chain